MKIKEPTFLLWLLIALAAIFIVLFAYSRASAMPIWGTDATSELIGSRSIGNGIETTGGWTEGFELSWNITKDSTTGLWTYNYTVAIAPTTEGNVKDLSYLIIEVTEGQNFSWAEVSPNLDTDSPQEYTYSPANNSLYGVKFEDYGVGVFSNGVWLYESSITSLHAPVYGVFAAKDGVYGGEGTYAWSTALGFDYRNDELLSATDFIVRLDGATPVPEPATCFLVGIGLLGLVGAHRKRR